MLFDCASSVEGSCLPFEAEQGLHLAQQIGGTLTEISQLRLKSVGDLLQSVLRQCRTET